MDLKTYIFVTDKNEKKQFSDYPATKGYVLYFYPKASTPGCTLETIEYNKEYQLIKQAGYQVIGISRDDVKANNKFSCAHDLAFPLICDTDKQLCEYFDVLKEKSMFGKKYMGIVRSTFILDNNLQIIKEMRDVKPVEHIDDVMKFIGA